MQPAIFYILLQTFKHGLHSHNIILFPIKRIIRNKPAEPLLPNLPLSHWYTQSLGNKPLYVIHLHIRNLVASWHNRLMSKTLNTIQFIDIVGIVGRR